MKTQTETVIRGVNPHFPQRALEVPVTISGDSETLMAAGFNHLSGPYDLEKPGDAQLLINAMLSLFARPDRKGQLVEGNAVGHDLASLARAKKCKRPVCLWATGMISAQDVQDSFRETDVKLPNLKFKGERSAA